MPEQALKTYIDETKAIVVCTMTGDVTYATERAQTLSGAVHARHIRDLLPHEHDVFIKKLAKEVRQPSSRATLMFEETNQLTRTMRYVYTALLGSVIVEIIDVTEQKIKERELRERALFDHATGLRNQIAFQDDVATEIATVDQKSGYGFGLIFLDLNDFKKINDVQGHLFGDVYLKTFAQALESRVRADDSVYRYGGDEFIIILRSIRTHEKLATILKNIHVLFAEMQDIDGVRVSYAASAGCALYERGMTADTLVHACDMAMYESKKRKKDESFPYTIFSPVQI